MSATSGWLFAIFWLLCGFAAATAVDNHYQDQCGKHAPPDEYVAFVAVGIIGLVVVRFFPAPGCSRVEVSSP